MRLITVNGKTYKSRYSCKNDSVQRLAHHVFVQRNLITHEEWMTSHEKLVDKFHLDYNEIKFDGRSRYAKTLPYFS